MAYHDTYCRRAGALLSPALGWLLALTGAVTLPLTVATAAEPDDEQWREHSPGVYTVKVAQETTGKPDTWAPRDRRGPGAAVCAPTPAPSPLQAPAPPAGDGPP